ncbi:hypothetical protein I4U30_22095 [Enterobacter asburiae]|uniref:hypothetical protein n=1 Tax=Enterobacter asburiae TaxID=61645 RepID=UPI00192B549E|nr:hypothetical protein [Enterobacter asburiae]MBL5840963.1 hypothetical protein [Enterobacter asburiae]
MKVKVTQQNKTMVTLSSLDPGDGFIFDGYPCIVGESLIGNYNGFVTAFDLRNAKIIAIPELQQVQLSQISVEYTV